MSIVGVIVVGIVALLAGFVFGVAHQSSLVAEYQGWIKRLEAERDELRQIAADIKKAL